MIRPRHCLAPLLLLLASSAALAPRPLAAETGGGWTAALPELLPALTSCLRQGDSAYVADARPGGAGRPTSLRVVMRDGRRRDCVAEGGQVREWRAVPDDAPGSGVSGADGHDASVFSLRRPSCAAARAVLDQAGHEAGWLALRGCF